MYTMIFAKEDLGQIDTFDVNHCLKNAESSVYVYDLYRFRESLW